MQNNPKMFQLSFECECMQCFSTAVVIFAVFKNEDVCVCGSVCVISLQLEGLRLLQHLPHWWSSVTLVRHVCIEVINLWSWALLSSVCFVFAVQRGLLHPCSISWLQLWVKQRLRCAVDVFAYPRSAALLSLTHFHFKHVDQVTSDQPVSGFSSNSESLKSSCRC